MTFCVNTKTRGLLIWTANDYSKRQIYETQFDQGFKIKIIELNNHLYMLNIL